MPRRRPTLAACLALAVPAAGCGAERVRPPDPTRPIFQPEPTTEREFPAAGLFFTAPADLRFEPGQAPLVASTASGTMVVAIWRYPRSEPLPRESLTAAEEALRGAAQTRDAQIRIAGTREVEVDGAPGIELTGTQNVAGRPRRVRSTHVYAKGAEFVVDAYAAERDFELVDRTVFRPLLRSLKIDPPTG